MLIGFGISPSMVKVTGGAVAFDADAQAFFTAASITDTTQKSAVNQLVLDLKSYNIWTKMKALYPIVGGSASSHAVNLKTPGTYNLTFATGITHSSTGMTGNGSTGYGDTGLLPNPNLLANNFHYSFYSRTTASTASTDIGVLSGSVVMHALSLYKSSLSSKIWISGTYPTNSAGINNNDTLGFQIGTRTSSTNMKLYWEGSLLATNTTNWTGGLPNNKVFILALSNSNSPSEYSNKQCAFASIGDGLTDTEAANFSTAVQAYQTTLSRNV